MVLGHLGSSRPRAALGSSLRLMSKCRLVSVEIKLAVTRKEKVISGNLWGRDLT